MIVWRQRLHKAIIAIYFVTLQSLIPLTKITILTNGKRVYSHNIHLVNWCF